MATSPAKKSAKRAAPPPKAAPAKKAAPAAKSAAKKAAPAKKVPVKKAAPAAKSAAKKAAPAKKAPVKKAAPAAKAASPAKAVAPAAKAAAPAKKAAAKPPVKKPAARKGPVVLDKFQDAQRKALLEERERLTRHSEALRAEADSLAADREAGDTQFDDESGEGDTLAVERERDLVLSHQAMQLVNEIDHALEKLTEGTYGVCEISGLAIPRERLKAIPWARERVEYKATGFIR